MSFGYDVGIGRTHQLLEDPYPFAVKGTAANQVSFRAHSAWHLTKRFVESSHHELPHHRFLTRPLPGHIQHLHTRRAVGGQASIVHDLFSNLTQRRAPASPRCRRFCAGFENYDLILDS